MIEHTIKKWEDFAVYASRFVKNDPMQTRYVYRGHGNAEWHLKPTLLRRVPEQFLNVEGLLRLEEAALGEFKAVAQHLTNQNLIGRDANILEWWMWMQQHGAPTRLLDWTRSIYVALYFAVIDQPEEPAAIWFYHTWALRHQNKRAVGYIDMPASQDDLYRFFSVDGSNQLETVMAAFKTARMIAQQAVFSVCRDVMGDHEKSLEHAFRGVDDELAFGRLVIPSDKKIEFLRELRAMNITAASLFPGLDGAARSVDELLLLPATQQ